MRRIRVCACRTRAPPAARAVAAPRWPFARAGPGNAYSLMVNDDNWKQDKFRITLGGNNFTLDYLNAGDSFEHECAAAKPAPRAARTLARREPPSLLPTRASRHRARFGA